MKKIFKLFVFLFLTTNVNAQIVNIPDANFKAKLLQADVTNSIAKDSNQNNIKIDSNNDGEIQSSEASQVYVLKINNSFLPNQNAISTISGIESFTNLKELNASLNTISSFNYNLPLLEILYLNSNILTSIDLTGIPELIELELNQNNLTTIDVSVCLNLNSISIDFNSLNNLDISMLSDLNSLSVRYNQLTSLDLSQSDSLTSLQISGNTFVPNLTNLNGLISLGCQDMALTSIDLSNNVNLGVLNLNNNNFTELILPSLPNLTTFFISEMENLTSLNVNSAPSLIMFMCNNNPLLESIFMKNGVEAFQLLNLEENFNLNLVCVNDSIVSNIFTYLNFIQLTNVNVTSYCSFTPGGNYNTITGTIRFDGENNGCNNDDAVFPYIKMNMTQWDVNNTTFSKLNGQYTFYTTFADQMVAPSIENPDWFTVTPESASISFPNNDNNVFTQDFCISANGVHPDVEVVLAPINPARPGFDATYKLVYKNKGNQTLSGTIALTFNDDKTDLISATPNPDNVISNSLSWNYSNLLPFESRVIQFTLNVNSPQETPAVNIDDVLNFVATINPITGDEIPNDNTFNYVQTVVGSYDPNDITCIEGNVVSPSEIGDYLHYVIRFENTGTAPAEFVVVKVDIDSNKYDTNTLQMLAASHDVYTRMVGNKIEFIFENIQLASGGHGNILLKIKTKPTLQVGDLVAKKADIYFDYNFPIITNNAETLFQAMNVVNPVLESIISIYPNPVKDSVNVTIKDNAIIKSIELFDIQGRLLQTQIINEIQTELNISSNPNGIYFIKINTDRGTKVEKLVKE